MWRDLYKFGDPLCSERSRMRVVKKGHTLCNPIQNGVITRWTASKKSVLMHISGVTQGITPWDIQLSLSMGRNITGFSGPASAPPQRPHKSLPSFVTTSQICGIIRTASHTFIHNHGSHLPAFLNVFFFQHKNFNISANTHFSMMK